MMNSCRKVIECDDAAEDHPIDKGSYTLGSWGVSPGCDMRRDMRRDMPVRHVRRHAVALWPAGRARSRGLR
jgi:hypothetical protein